MTTLIFKKCSKCKEEKPIDAFLKSKKVKIGIDSVCKKCASLKFSIWKNKNKELVKSHSKNAYKKVRDNITNYYCANSLRSFYPGKKIKSHEIPFEIIETKRLQLTLHRLIKEKTLQQIGAINVD